MLPILATSWRQTTQACARSISTTNIPLILVLPLFTCVHSPATKNPRVSLVLTSPLSLVRRIHASLLRASNKSDKASQTITHYEIFPETLPAGPPPKGPFTIDVKALRREFLKLQAQAHPDLHPAKNKARAQGVSALINEAFKTLSNPLLRAQYLLGIRGINPAEDERARVDDPMLLMTVMEVHEAIQEADKEEELEGVNSENEERIKQSEDVLEQAFNEDDVEAALRECVRLRYWVNIRDSIRNWEPGKVVSFQH